uniref:HMA domain-containing protein n=1 Tax=Macrostomum lignano TaxID=282301 RepID=A0A1I8H6T2_9PLAT
TAKAASWVEFFADQPQNKLRVFDWSVSGFETCIVVHGPSFRLALDIGACPPQAISADHVFISHGHVDHCGALHQHMRRRQLVGLPPATYYVPEHLVQPLIDIARLFSVVHGDEDEDNEGGSAKLSTKDKKSKKEDATVADGASAEAGSDEIKIYGKIVAATPGDDLQLSKNLRIRPFATDHRVPSIGCLVYCKRSQLLPKYAGLPGAELAELARNGEQLREARWEPAIGYTGDTRFTVLACPPEPDLLKVRLLVCELTYVEGPTDTAEKYGHCHLHDFSSRANLFDNVGQLLFVHFSRRHSPDQVINAVLTSLPEELRSKLQFAVNMTCQSCADSVSRVLSSHQPASDFADIRIQLTEQRVILRTSLHVDSVLELLETTGCRAVLQGVGTASQGMRGQDFASGVVQLESVYTTNTSSVQGVVRILQPDDQQCLFDGTVDGLERDSWYSLEVRQGGDLSGGSDTCGPVYNDGSDDAQRLHGNSNAYGLTSVLADELTCPRPHLVPVASGFLSNDLRPLSGLQKFLAANFPAPDLRHLKRAAPAASAPDCSRRFRVLLCHAADLPNLECSEEFSTIWRPKLDSVEISDDPSGLVGRVHTGPSGRLRFSLISNRLRLWNLVGRCLTVSKSAGCSENVCAAGIVARSAGLFANDKRICSCDGVEIWSERDVPSVGAGRAAAAAALKK